MKYCEYFVYDNREIILFTIGENPIGKVIAEDTILREGMVSELSIDQEQKNKLEHESWRLRANGFSFS